MKVTLFDEAGSWRHLLPLTYTRPIAELRVGILTIREKWSKVLQADTISWNTQSYLQKKYPTSSSEYWINASVCPNNKLTEQIHDLQKGESLSFNGRLVALRAAKEVSDYGDWQNLRNRDLDDEPVFIDRTWKMFRNVAEEIRHDFEIITNGRSSAPVPDRHTIVYGEENLFIEEGARIQAAVIDATNGPVYLGKNSYVSPGAIIRGAFALGEESVVNMGAKLRGDTAVGPGCKVGGEISNSVFQGNCNKSHDGYLGNSVIGEWCNLGADTNTSNLKNNYANVKVWSYDKKEFADTGLQFCGLTMGDHSKCGINTMFNTGTVTGVACNIFGAGFPRTFIPSFSWGGASGMNTHQMNKALETARLVMERRNISLTEADIDIFQHIFDESAEFRVWEGSS